MGARFGFIAALIAAAFAGAFVIAESGRAGSLQSRFLYKQVVPSLLRISGVTTDLKFRFRGQRPVKNKITLVEIDDPSVRSLGRWPWPREQTAYLIEKIYKYHPRAVGLDMVFSEAEQKVPSTLADQLEARNLSHLIPDESQSEFVKSMERNARTIVVGWMTETGCNPRFPGPDGCPVTDPDNIRALPKDFGKFSVTGNPTEFNAADTAVWSAPSVVNNVADVSEQLKHAGFVNSLPDPDGTIRVAPLVGVVGGKFFPSLPLALARAGMRDAIMVQANKQSDVEQISFAKLKLKVVTNRRGMAEVNHRGPSGSFNTISAVDLLTEKNILEGENNRKLAGLEKAELLRDAFVLVGVTALAMHDYRPTPFEGAVPGLEIQGTILDNILSFDFLTQGNDRVGFWAVLLLMTLGMFGVTMTAKRLEAWPALLNFAGFMVTIVYLDFAVLFPYNHDWNTGFLYLEAMALIGFTLIAKYLAEEQKKKFLRVAFGKYLAPAVVDQIVRDPTSLQLGGSRKPLTILFSDIRGFTTFSERMDAKLLSEFLNDYLGIMTSLVFENRGTLDKYIGDAIMAFWGAPVDNGAHASDCCQTAVKMMSALAAHRPRFKEQYGVDVHIGVGINTGEVSVGNMGSQASFSYTVIGDSVNLASRLEGATKAYGIAILATQGTLDSIREEGVPVPEHRVLDSVKVKGKKKAVEIVEILYREVPREALELFQQGRSLYTKQDWDAAIARFNDADRKVQEVFGEPDGPSRTYLARCEKFKADPPGPDWDGSWEFDSK